jgi:hypothetical protein
MQEKFEFVNRQSRHTPQTRISFHFFPNLPVHFYALSCHSVDVQQLKSLIARGKIEEVLKMLLQPGALSDNDHQSSAIALSGQWSNLRQDDLRGTLSMQDANRERNRITAALLSLIDDLGKPQIVMPNPSATGGVQKILFLAANPMDTGRLRLDKEHREIQERLRSATQRDRFELEQRFAVRTRDFTQALLDLSPQFLHFSGHGYTRAATGGEGERMLHLPPTSQPGYEGGLAFEDTDGKARYVSGAALADLISLFASTLNCIVLNACYSASQVDDLKKAFNSIEKSHPVYVIGMNAAVPDDTAIDFAAKFYAAIGAGRDIPFAFNFAIATMDLESMPGTHIPQIIEL